MGAEKAFASSFVIPSSMTIVSLLHFCAVVPQQRATRFTSFLDNLGLRRRFRIRTCRVTISGSAGFAMARMLPQSIAENMNTLAVAGCIFKLEGPSIVWVFFDERLHGSLTVVGVNRPGPYSRAQAIDLFDSYYFFSPSVIKSGFSFSHGKSCYLANSDKVNSAPHCSQVNL